MLYLLTFASTHHALTFEKMVTHHMFCPFTLRPVPREISASCGLAAQCTMDEEILKKILLFCKIHAIQVEHIYHKVENQDGTHYEKIAL